MEEKRIFTEQERHIIDGAYKKLSNDEDITVNEFRLVSEFEKNNALWNADRKAEQARQDKIIQAEIEKNQIEAQASADALKKLSDAMVAQYMKTCNKEVSAYGQKE